ncbi:MULTISPECIES: hypothetical protein [Bacillus cereus group]|uniref:hypothetical protein n=1 Tax=Bacillus cereus group TaxID=86661 RepID=UPI001CFAD297|nr:hypothetical protein [Bacillus thuringiensis]
MKFKQIILAGAVLATSTFSSLTNAHANDVLLIDRYLLIKLHTKPTQILKDSYL